MDEKHFDVILPGNWIKKNPIFGEFGVPKVSVVVGFEARHMAGSLGYIQPAIYIGNIMIDQIVLQMFGYSLGQISDS